MTPEEILNELEGLKDCVNDARKLTLERIKQELVPYFGKPKEVVVEKEKIVEKPVTVEKIVEKTVVAEGDRRSDPRDPFEHEQHVAEEAGLTGKKHKK